MMFLKNKKFVFAICTLCTIALLSYFYQKNNVIAVSEITTKNIEALAQGDDDDVIHLWCCGNKLTCAKGDNVKIIGKMSASPCQSNSTN